jgi:hypothetical protein
MCFLASAQMNRSEAQPSPDTPAAASIYSGALGRIRRSMLVLTAPAVAGTWLWFGWRSALGMACGCAVAYLNFHWLEGGVEALADRIVVAGKSQSGKGIVVRFLFRYVLLALAAYAIVTVSPASLYGFLAGLSLPVAAIACEAAYEAYLALARGL